MSVLPLDVVSLCFDKARRFNNVLTKVKMLSGLETYCAKSVIPVLASRTCRHQGTQN